VIRLVQDARKASGLDVTDRIVLAIDADGDAARAVDVHGDAIAAETLAVELRRGAVADGQEASLDGDRVLVSLRRSD
jgi:isoleucyl-tRNA synthetase